MHTKAWYKRRTQKGDGVIHLLNVVIEELEDMDQEMVTRNGVINMLRVIEQHGRRDV